MSGLGPADVLPLLRALADAGAVLIGGQALNVWCEHYRTRVAQFRTAVFTSRDVDAQGSRDAVEACAQTFGVRPYWPREEGATNVGYLEVDVGGRKIGVNLLHSPYGVKRQDAFDTAVPVQVGEVTIRVLHPVLCMEGKIATLALPRDLARERAQADAAILCAREWIRDVADEDPPTALDLIERIFRFARSNIHAKAARREHALDVFDAVQPWPTLPETFAEKRYPEMRTQLYERRPRNRKR